MSSARRLAGTLLARQLYRQCPRIRHQSTIAQAARGPGYASNVKIVQPALTTVRWHSAPASQSKHYDFAGIKEMTEKPSPDRVLIGNS